MAVKKNKQGQGRKPLPIDVKMVRYMGGLMPVYRALGSFFIVKINHK